MHKPFVEEEGTRAFLPRIDKLIRSLKFVADLHHNPGTIRLVKQSATGKQFVLKVVSLSSPPTLDNANAL